MSQLSPDSMEALRNIYSLETIEDHHVTEIMQYFDQANTRQHMQQLIQSNFDKALAVLREVFIHPQQINDFETLIRVLQSSIKP